MNRKIQILNRTEKMRRNWDNMTKFQKTTAMHYSRLAYESLLDELGLDFEGYPRVNAADAWSLYLWFKHKYKSEKESKAYD